MGQLSEITVEFRLMPCQIVRGHARSSNASPCQKDEQQHLEPDLLRHPWEAALAIFARRKCSLGYTHDDDAVASSLTDSFVTYGTILDNSMEIAPLCLWYAVRYSTHELLLSVLLNNDFIRLINRNAESMLVSIILSDSVFIAVRV